MASLKAKGSLSAMDAHALFHLCSQCLVRAVLGTDLTASVRHNGFLEFLLSGKPKHLIGRECDSLLCSVGSSELSLEKAGHSIVVSKAGN